MDLRGVAGRFHRSVLPAQPENMQGGLALSSGIGELALLRHCHAGDCEGRLVEELVLEGGEEALAQGIVFGVPKRTHGGANARLTAAAAEGDGELYWQPWSQW